MKRLIVLTVLIFSSFSGYLYGQTFDWNIRGGLNIMPDLNSDGKVFYGYHAGVQAGVRVSYWGFYGEGIYSLNANQDGGDPVAYIMPGINIKRYLKQFLFVDFGGALLIVAGDPGLSESTLNPENKPLFMAGLGAKISKFELSLRVLSRSSYAIIQATAAVKF